MTITAPLTPTNIYAKIKPFVLNTIEKTTSGGKPYATVVVAASNTSAADAANADYVCDGTDDHSEINSAIFDAAVAGQGGGRVLLLEGTYTITSAIALSDYVVLEGQGQGTEIRIPNSHNTSQAFLSASNQTGFEVKNLAINGRKGVQSSGFYRAIDLSGCSDVRVASVSVFNVHGSTSHCIRVLSQSENLVFEDLWLEGCDGNGISVSSSTGFCRYIQVLGGHYDGNAGEDIEMFDTEFVTIDDAHFLRYGASSQYAVRIQDSSFFTVSNGQFDRCGDPGVGGGAIITADAEMGDVHDNVIYDCHNGVYLSSTSRYDAHIDVHDNEFEDFSNRAIIPDAVDRVKIHNNTIWANTNGGTVAIEYDMIEGEISHNWIYCNSNVSHGIAAIFDSEDVTIESNHVFDSTSDAYTFSAENALRIIDNEAIRAGRHGFNISSYGGATVDDFTVRGNKSVLAQQHGFRITALSHSRVSENDAIDSGQATDNTYDNFFIDSNCDENFIKNNKARHSGLAAQPRYGMNIAAATCDDNIVDDNDLRQSGKTANYNDAGTGTLGSNWT